MKIFYARAIASFLLFFACVDLLLAQISIPLQEPVKEDFNAMATGLTLPANWKVSAAGQGATAAWATGLTSLTQAANSGSPASGGSYNWATTTGTDRAVGFLSSAGYASPNAVMAHFRNATGSAITTLTISFSIERYRINTSGFSLGFSSSGDGSAWIERSAGSIAAGLFASGASEYSFDTPATIHKTVTLSGLNIADNADIYFRWVFTDGVAANAQGLGLDNVSVFAGAPTAAVSSTLRYLLKTDNIPIDQANPGDELTYQTTIKNSGTGDAANVVLTEPAPGNTTFIAGSVKTSTIARDETFITPFNTPLSGGNVLSNDYGIPAPAVISFGPTAGKSSSTTGSSGSSDNGGVVALNADGTFTYTPPAGFSGNDHFGYIAGNGNPPNNDATVTVSVGAAAVANADSYNVVGNVPISPNSASGFLSNDTGGGLIVTSVNGSAANIGAALVTGAGGNLTVNSDGSFTYNPSPGFTGSDSFTYTTDNGFSAPASATVTLNVAGVVWFVNNNAATNGDGRLTNPFKSIGNVTGTAAGQTIFLYESATAYSGSITLLATQKLIGQDASESLQTITGLVPNATYSVPFPAMNSGNGVHVLLTASNANIITLNSGNTIRGMTVGNAGTGKKITGSSFGTLTLGNTTTPDLILNGTGQALDLQTGTLTGALTSLTTTSSAAQGVLINSVAGAFHFGATTVAGSTTQGILISGSSSIVPTFGATVVSAGTDGVSVQNNTGNVTFNSLGITTANGIGLLGSNNSGQLIVTNNTSGINATGGAAISLSTASGTSTVNLNFSGLTSAGGINGLNLTNIAGTLAGGNGSLTGSGTVLNVNGGSASVTYSGTLNHSAATFYLVDIKNTTGGAITLSGNLTASGSSQGIRINDTTGGTVTFSGASKSLTTGANAAVSLVSNGTSTIIFSGGGLVVNTTSGTGFNATGGGIINVTGAGNTITSTTGMALNVNATTIGASGLTFQSIDVNGAAKGISLNNTGAGGLEVTGTGTTDGSGGTIQNTITRGAEFISASSISLKNMNFTNACTADFPAAPTNLSLGNNTADNAVIHFQTVTNASLDNLNITGSAEHGINGHTVTNFTLANSVLLNCGNAADEDGLHFYNMLGTNDITSTTVTSSGDDNVNIQNDAGTSTINVTGGSFNTGVLGSGLSFGPGVSSNTTINISGVTCNNNAGGGVIADCSNGASMDIEVSTSTITNNNDGIKVLGASGNVKFDIHDNTNISGQDLANITILKAASSVGGTLEGKIRNNSITTENGHGADGISVFNAGGGTLKIAITGNTINYAGAQRAILLQGGQDGASALEATVTGNSIAIQLDGSSDATVGILAQSQVTDPSGAGSSLCIDIGGAGALSNTFTHPLGGIMLSGDIRVRQRFAANVRLPGYAGGNNTTAVGIFLDSRNAEVTPSTASLQDGSFSGGAACSQPSF